MINLKYLRSTMLRRRKHLLDRRSQQSKESPMKSVSCDWKYKNEPLKLDGTDILHTDGLTTERTGMR
ncbi:MAG: hypothetical protein EZS28_053204 [Streblomastix strix]|uniref:Uncharacterized protein n=1 Tax=Streblomastix strix TaxID=222440 RepID=A0A5J4RG98_9EUKA|nr:MAG: hypothetical protein EZS28_053204 [Streblomastix strix]